MVAMSHRQQADISTSHWSGSMWDASVWEHWLDIMASGRHRLHIVLTECSLLFYQKKNKKKKNLTTPLDLLWALHIKAQRRNVAKQRKS